MSDHELSEEMTRQSNMFDGADAQASVRRYARRVRDLETRLAERDRWIEELRAEINDWQDATGLEGAHGAPDTVTPSDLRNRLAEAERGAEELSQWRAKNAADPVSLSRKIRNTHRLGLDMSGQIRVSNDILTAWERDAESMEHWLHELSMQMKARHAIDGWLAQFDGDDEVSYSVTEHPDTGLRKYAVFQYGNKATFTDQDWYPSPAALADVLLGEKWRES